MLHVQQGDHIALIAANMVTLKRHAMIYTATLRVFQNEILMGVSTVKKKANVLTMSFPMPTLLLAYLLILPNKEDYHPCHPLTTNQY
ncbi:hypothetical protein AMTR_s00089p00155690 [Amborella trichopoda]|uniref:Uncharacterized protein n=1 Tax=Amborella trichopoda TaxID=13333 RepID=W1P4L2_AMBTC|nr:hypothetical protein AMTR_s00089p00155690 [Amborella trichopoda]